MEATALTSVALPWASRSNEVSPSVLQGSKSPAGMGLSSNDLSHIACFPGSGEPHSSVWSSDLVMAGAQSSASKAWVAFFSSSHPGKNTVVCLFPFWSPLPITLGSKQPVLLCLCFHFHI